MEPRDHLKAFVIAKGGVAAAAAAIGAPAATLYSVLNGWRGVSRQQASQWAVASGGELAAEKLVWIKPTKKPEIKANAA